jgi:hypothetical protein
MLCSGNETWEDIRLMLCPFLLPSYLLYLLPPQNMSDPLGYNWPKFWLYNSKRMKTR